MTPTQVRVAALAQRFYDDRRQNLAAARIVRRRFKSMRRYAA